MTKDRYYQILIEEGNKISKTGGAEVEDVYYNTAMRILAEAETSVNNVVLDNVSNFKSCSKEEMNGLPKCEKQCQLCYEYQKL
jgi:hypothetical protein